MNRNTKFALAVLALGGGTALAAPTNVPLPVGQVLEAEDLQEIEGKAAPVIFGVGVSVGAGLISRAASGQPTTWKDVAADAIGGLAGGGMFMITTKLSRTFYTTNTALRNAAPVVGAGLGVTAADTAEEISKQKLNTYK